MENSIKETLDLVRPDGVTQDGRFGLYNVSQLFQVLN